MSSIDLLLLDPNADLSSMFDKTGNTPRDGEFDWEAFTVTPSAVGLDPSDISGQFPFPAQQARASYPSSEPYPALDTGNSFARSSVMEQAVMPDMEVVTEMFTANESAVHVSSGQQLAYNIGMLDSQAQTTIENSADSRSLGRTMRASSSQERVHLRSVAADTEGVPKVVRRRGARKKVRTEEELRTKREDHLERNRNAAQRCRARKKNSEDKRREETLALSNRNQELWVLFEGLRQELLILRETEFPKVEPWETEKLEACKRAIELEQQLSAKIYGIRQLHDQSNLLRRPRQDSPPMGRSASEMSHGTNAREDHLSPHNADPMSRTSSQQNAGAIVYFQEESQPHLIASTYNLVPLEHVKVGSHGPGPDKGLRVETALSTHSMSSSHPSSSPSGYSPGVHRRSHDSAITNLNTPESRTLFGSSLVGSPLGESPQTDEAFGSAASSPVHEADCSTTINANIYA